MRCTWTPADMQALGVDIEVVDADERAAEGCELVLVLGGDGTFLRAAELARNAEIPVLGVNLGRIGFLAEAEAEAIDTVLEHVIARNYRVEERMTLDIAVRGDGQVVSRAAGRSTRPAWRRARGSASSASSWRSTAGRCPRSAVTACWCPARPDPPPMRSRRAARWCGRTWRQFWWCPTTLTRCSPARWSPARHATIAIEIDGDSHDALVLLRRPPGDATARRRPPGGDQVQHPAEMGAAGQRAVHRPAGAQVPPAGHRLARAVNRRCWPRSGSSHWARSAPRPRSSTAD